MTGGNRPDPLRRPKGAGPAGDRETSCGPRDAQPGRRRLVPRGATLLDTFGRRIRRSRWLTGSSLRRGSPLLALLVYRSSDMRARSEARTSKPQVRH